MEEKKFKVKKIEGMDLEKYKKKENYSNPYYQQYGVKNKSYFSVVT